MLNPYRLLVFLGLAALLFAGCQDTCVQTMTYTVYEPVFKTKAEFQAMTRVGPPETLKQPGKIYIKDNYLFINELGKGIHVYNNRNPKAPAAVSFIHIPGNVDMAVKGSILYADNQMDLVAIDIAEPARPQVTGRVSNIFPSTQFNPGRWFAPTSTPDGMDTSKTIVSWVKREERQVAECAQLQTGWMQWRGNWAFAEFNSNKALNSSASGPVFSGGAGKGGSMARFAVVDDYLYTIDVQSLRSFDIRKATAPVFRQLTMLGNGIETVFPHDHYLFFGTTTGMLIYDIRTPETPAFVSMTTHFVGCDPVVVEGDFAYVTVKGGTACRSEWPSQLEVVNIADIRNPRTVKTYPMTDPNGLGVDGNTLFICDGKAGLKVYDLTDRNAIDQNLLTTKAMHTYDIIPFQKVAIVVGNDGLHQYDYTDPKNLELLSTLQVVKD